MVFVSLTRLRVRSIRFLPAFLMRTVGTERQVKRAAGFRGGALLADRHRTFWTVTLWDDQAAMRAYMLSGAHREVMPKLARWCDEASVAHWEQASAELPTWEEVECRMRADGRPSKVRFPSPDHETLTFAHPRTTRTVALLPVAPGSPE